MQNQTLPWILRLARNVMSDFAFRCDQIIIGGFTLDISSALEVCLKCTSVELVCERVLFHLTHRTQSPREISKHQSAEVHSQVRFEPSLRVYLSNQSVGCLLLKCQSSGAANFTLACRRRSESAHFNISMNAIS